MNVNYEYYRIFYYVAKYKNITQAAKVLQSNQPNISRAIRLLESEMGCRLLIRSNRGISLTPEGKRLYGHVKIAVERLQLAEEEIAEAISMQDGCVTIGASETALRMLLLPVLGIFKKKYPQIRIRILNHLTIEAIEKGEVYPLSTAEELPSRQICFVENERNPLSIAAKELKSLLMQCTMEQEN